MPRSGSEGNLRVSRPRRLTLGRTVLRVLIRSLGVGFVVTLVVFGLIRFIPGDPVVALLGDFATQESHLQMEEQLGLSGTIWQQGVEYFGGIIRGDLGRSIVSQVPVSQIVRESMIPTLALISLAGVIGVLTAVPVGVILAFYPRTKAASLLRQGMIVALSIPIFFLGLIAILFVALRWELAPVAGFSDIPSEMLGYLWLPATVIALGNLLPVLSRVIESSVRSTLKEQFVEVAFVRGVNRVTYLWHYLLRPSLAPTVALAGYLFVAMMGASVVVELVFNLPGIGLQLVRAVVSRDYPVIQGILLVFGVMSVLVSAASEFAVTALDPRVR